jgi:hypothetical protein
VNPRDYVTARQGTTTTELINLLSEAGFEIETVEVRRNLTRHEDGEEFVNFLESSSFGNYLTHVPEALRPAVRVDFTDELESLNRGNGVESVGHSIAAVAAKPGSRGTKPECAGCRGCG